MDKLIKPGRIMFAAGILGLSILCIINKDFIVGRPPAWPSTFNINPALAYISAGILIIAVIGILFNKKAATAALLIAVLIFLLSVLRHLPQFMKDWVNAYKAMALCGGALIVAASFYRDNSGAGNRSRIKYLVIAGTVLLAAFFIAGGYAHFKWAKFVQYLIPEYIPFRLFWTYFCGVCLFAGGAGLLLPQTRKWAAFLTGIMILGWFFLLHIPRFIANTSDASDRMGVCESFIFSSVLFVLTGLVSKNNKTGN
jgi:uncharacterized membrane protein